MWDDNNEIGDPIQSLEIDTKGPVCQLYDYGIEDILVDSQSLEVSFGGRKVTITVARKSFRNK